MRRILLSVSAALALAAAAPLMAVAMEEGAMTHSAVPQIEPVVLGEVSMSNAHSVTVTTLDHETMPFEFDSRTVMPQDLATGTRVRVEWRMLDSGLHLAQRITPLTRGSKDWDLIENRMAEADWHENLNAENDENVRPAVYEGENTENAPAQSNGVSETEQNGEHHDTDVDKDHDSDRDRDQSSVTTATRDDDDNDRHAMADTASDLPLYLGAGLLLLTGALCLRWMRRRSA